MATLFNRQKIQKVLNDFFACTKIGCSFFDKNGEQVAYSEKTVEYCDTLRTNPLFYSKCVLSDKTSFIFSKDHGKTVIYTCHGGIIESVTPIIDQNSVIGYLILGRFKDAEKILSDEKKASEVIKQYDFPMEKLLCCYNNLPVFSLEEIYSAISIIELSIKEIWHEGAIKIENDTLLANIENYLSVHIKEKISVSDVCLEFGISKHLLYSLFHNNYSDTFTNYLIKKRLKLAQELLVGTNKSLDWIAEETGFSDYNYFIKTFKKHTKSSPNKYRTAQRDS